VDTHDASTAASRGLRDRGVLGKILLGLGVAALALIVVLQNRASGKISALFWTIEAPGWVWLTSLFLAGFVVGSIFPWLRQRQH
jgi:uncharacterized integral membrane protein